jgi:hypothetical protein
MTKQFEEQKRSQAAGGEEDCPNGCVHKRTTTTIEMNNKGNMPRASNPAE